MAKSADLESLREMDARAKNLAECLNCPDHWAKPFYSDVHVFKQGVRRVFIGLNSKGNRYSHEYDKQQENHKRIWSGKKPLHNAYLDECWGGEAGGPIAKGRASLQIAVQSVFEAMYGPAWEAKLRNTPCFNLIPVSSDGIGDPELVRIWDDGVKWSSRLLRYLDPKLIILYGNATSGKSVWTALRKRYSFSQEGCTIEGIPPNYRMEFRKLQKEPLKGVPVVGLPHLSRQGGLPAICGELRRLAASTQWQGYFK